MNRFCSREMFFTFACASFDFLISPCSWEESGDLQCEISVMSAFVARSPVSFAAASCRFLRMLLIAGGTVASGRDFVTLRCDYGNRAIWESHALLAFDDTPR